MDRKDIMSIDGVITCEPTGSRVVCNPPPRGTDEDWICLIHPSSIKQIHGNMREQGYEDCGSEVDPGDGDCVFFSMKKDDVNLIFISDSKHYDRFRLATKVAKHLNLTIKADRIMVFEAIRNGVFRRN